MAKKPEREALRGGGFDDEVDAARKRLEESLVEESAFDDLAALQALAPLLEEKIQSRRLAFRISEDDDEETSIAIIHVPTDEDLGFIFAEEAARFVERLYENLRADLPKYEVENKR
jgi:hypothetical protein